MTDEEILLALKKRIEDKYGHSFNYTAPQGVEYRDAGFLQKGHVRVYRKFGNCWRFSDCKGVGFVDLNYYSQYRLAGQFRMIDLVGDPDIIWDWFTRHYTKENEVDIEMNGVYGTLSEVVRQSDKKISGEYIKFAKKHLKSSVKPTKVSLTPTQYYYYDGDESYETRTLEVDLFHPSNAERTCSIVFQVRRDTATKDLSVWYFFRKMDVTGDYPELLETTEYIPLGREFGKPEIEEIFKQYILTDSCDLAGSEDLDNSAVEELENLVETML